MTAENPSTPAAEPDGRLPTGQPALGERWATGLVCSRTGVRAPLDEPASVSPDGAPWLVDYAFPPALANGFAAALARRPWSLWRYLELLPVADLAARVDLGEGATPLVPLSRFGGDQIELLVKDESGNPTGSFKARGMAVAITRARELGAAAVELASAGNAAIALAAYAAAAGLEARVALPDDTPATVEEWCRGYGATVIRSGATLVDSRRALAADPIGAWDLSTFREPYRVEGKKTMGLELAEQLGWELPEWIVYPTGGGTGIVGMHKAFRELAALGLVTDRLPRFVVVQMTGCAPLVRAWERGATSAEPWEDVETAVWGLRVPSALADFLVLEAVRASDGAAVAVGEAEAAEAGRRVQRLEGLLVGPEGAAALRAVELLAERRAFAPGDRVVAFQTGHPASYR